MKVRKKEGVLIHDQFMINDCSKKSLITLIYNWKVLCTHTIKGAKSKVV